jgi:hypothetical protein
MTGEQCNRPPDGQLRSIGHVAVWRDEQRHVVVATARDRAKRTGTRGRGRAGRSRRRRRAEVRADVEDELVPAGAISPEATAAPRCGRRRWCAPVLTSRARPSASTIDRSIRRPAAGQPRDVSRTWVVSPSARGAGHGASGERVETESGDLGDLGQRGLDLGVHAVAQARLEGFQDLASCRAGARR